MGNVVTDTFNLFYSLKYSKTAKQYDARILSALIACGDDEQC